MSWNQNGGKKTVEFLEHGVSNTNKDSTNSRFLTTENMESIQFILFHTFLINYQSFSGNVHGEKNSWKGKKCFLRIVLKIPFKQRRNTFPKVQENVDFIISITWKYINSFYSTLPSFNEIMIYIMGLWLYKVSVFLLHVMSLLYQCTDSYGFLGG